MCHTFYNQIISNQKGKKNLKQTNPKFGKGSLHNYVDKMRWIGDPKIPIFVHVVIE